MKCLLLFFTICSVGKLINVQGQGESDSDSDSDSHLTLLPAEDDSDSSADSEVIKKQYKDDLTALLSGAGTEEDDTSSDETTDDAEVTDNRYGKSSSRSSSSSDSSTDIQELGSAMSAKQADIAPKMVEKRIKEREKQAEQFNLEMLAGDPTDVIGQNEHIRQAEFYDDLGRRSIPRDSRNTEAKNDDYLIPEKAPPELVLLVAKESALLGPGKDADFANDFDPKKILRSGDYWNGVWKEEVKPKSAMRSGTQKKNLGSIKAKINEGTELYKVVSKMKDISPKLLYIINKKQL